MPNREFPEQLHEGLLVIGKGATIPAGIQLMAIRLSIPGSKKGIFRNRTGEGATIKPKP